MPSSRPPKPLVMGALMVLLMVGCFSIGLYVVGPRVKGGFEQPQGLPAPSNAGRGEEQGADASAVAGGVEVVELPPLPRPKRNKAETSQTASPNRASEDGRASRAVEVQPPPEEQEAWQTPEEPPAAHEDVGPPASTDRIYRVQAGVFEDLDNAKALADRLVQAGFDATIATERTADKVRYRVQVGAFKDRQLAVKAAELLQSSGFESYITED
ncbi:MAG: SPOR domain-containing protein [Armatimonadota bacterium]